jgi:uncharacterized protein (TIGR03435 family)
MFPAFWNEVWTAALVNHLWQSTVVALIAWLLALALKKNQARTRYWLWMTASVKFLLPFSLLIAAGESLRRAAAVPIQKPALAAVMEQITEPFPRSAKSIPFTYIDDVPTTAAHHANLLSEILPLVLLAIWLCGFLAITFSWARRWLQIRSAVRAAAPVSSPITLLAEVPVLSTPRLLEPGVFGIFRPVLLLPESITGRLSTQQLDTILAHEMCHVRRRDNLTAAIHMVVEAIFWFHPAVWWIKARLLEERERACDEAVLQSGNEAELYAESILNVCKFYVESPLTCVSGVTGSDLKQRIVRIMTKQVARKLDLSRKLLLGMAAATAVAAPVVFGLVHITQVRAQTGTQSAPESQAQGLAGTWQGTLHAGADLRIVFKITNADGGGYKAVNYSIDQGGAPIPVASVTLEGTTVKISVTVVGGTYEGKLSADGKSIIGNWSQGNPLPLNLTRATPETEWTIPPPPPPVVPMAADANPSFEVATIKPSTPNKPGKGFGFRAGHFVTLNTNLNDLIAFAYGLHAKQIVGAPEWFGVDLFDIEGKPDAEGRPNSKQMKTMVQKLLADRFKLTFHHDKRELSVYVISVASGGPKMTKSTSGANDPSAFFFRSLGDLTVRNQTMADFATWMQSGVMDKPVVDQTGLTDRYDFQLKWTPDDSQFAQFRGTGVTVPPPTDDPKAPPSLYTAIQEQLGLKMGPAKVPDDVIVIDHAEKPSEN